MEARRSDKTYPMTSPELMRELGAYLLGKHNYLKAVSYTHLDVYKRQALTAQQPRAIYVLLGTNVLGRDTDYSSFLTYYRLMLGMLSQTLPNAKIYAVSYTHLKTPGNVYSKSFQRFCAKNFQKKVDEPEKMRYTVYC